MRTIFNIFVLALGMILVLLLGGAAQATTYYVSSSQGNDANAGTSASAPWQTLAHVNAQTFNPGDTILFNRGDVWNESLTPPSSGASGNPITFDAYGVGAPPNFTGYYEVPASAWINVTGNVWKAPLIGYTTVNFCLFGSIWGQKVPAASSNLTAQWDFYLAAGSLYVYSVGNPSLYYNEPIVPMALSNVPVINVNSKSWLVFQHILVNWFDQYGVYVQGTSDHLVFANMEADSMIPQGTQPLGFYVSESAPGPGDIKIYNASAHMNYDGFRFDGSATAITMVNDNGYANRDGALVDNTSAVTYSYCHFYASSLAVAGSTDVEWTTGTGPTAGAGNIPADTPPAVEVWQRYPARVTLTVDDIGMTPGADSYYAGTVLPVAQAAGVPVGVAVTTGYTGEITPLISEIQGWINEGIDVTAHSVSHTYYVNTNALTIQYTGTGTAATLNISGNVLTITVTGASDSVSYNLANGSAEGTIYLLENALNATGKFTATLPSPPCQGPYGTGCSFYTAPALLSQDLASVTGQDVKTNAYTLQLNVSQLQSDEITLSRQWMTQNLTGLPATPVYVYPGGYEDPAMEAMAAGVPYAGARGALHEGGTANNGQPIAGANDTYASGYNVQDITSFGVNPTWMGIAPAALKSHVQALVWKEQVWGVPWAVFWHLNELTQSDPVGGEEITDLVEDFVNAGATIQTNTGLVNWLTSGTQETGNDGNYYYKSAATGVFSASGGMDFRPTAQSPVVNAGENLGAAYEIDINGINQNSYGTGWEIGAHAFIGDTTYGLAGSASSSHFTMGTPAGTMGLAVLPQVWVDNNEATDGLVAEAPQNELQLGTSGGIWVNGPPAGCTFALANYTNTFTGLQDAVNDVEACRTLKGGTAGFYIDVPPGMYSTSSNIGLVIPQSNTSLATGFIVLRSTMDASLPLGRTVCAHGVQDNLASSSDIGLENPDCSGQNMYYDLGPTQTAADSGSGTGANCVSASMSGSTATFTLVSGTHCNPTWPGSFVPGAIVQAAASAAFVPAAYKTYWQILSGGSGTATFTAQSCSYGATQTCLSGLGNSTTSGEIQNQNIIAGETTLSVNTTTLLPVTVTGSNIVIPLANGYVSPGVALTVDTGANQETVTTVSGPNQIGMLATFTKTHASGVAVTYCAAGCVYTLANGQTINTASYNDLEYMWQVSTTGETTPSALTTCHPLGTSSTSVPPACAQTSIGPDHWLIEDVAASPAVGNGGAAYAIGLARTGTETAETQWPTHMHFRKVWAHGDWSSLYTGSNVISDAIELQCVYCSLVDSQVSEHLKPGGEGHSISSQGTTYKYAHNWVEGGSSGNLAGGYSNGVGVCAGSAFCSTWVPFCDVEERRNVFTYPFQWLGMGPIGSGLNPNLNGAWSTVRKIAQETKSGCRIAESGNIYQNTDPSGGNYTQGRAYHAFNESANPGSNYNTTIHDVYHNSNIIRNTCSGFDITRSEQNSGNGYGVGYSPANISISNDLLYAVSTNAFNAFCGGTANYGFDLENNLSYGWTVTVTTNAMGTAITINNASDLVSGLPVGGASGTGTIASGTLSLTSCPSCPSAGFSSSWNNQIEFLISGAYYPVSSCSSSTSCGLSGSPPSGSVSFVATPIGSQAFDMQVGQAVPLLGCATYSALDTPTSTFGSHTVPSPGYKVTQASAAWTGTWSSANTTAVLQGLGSPSTPAGVTDTCTIYNYESTPQSQSITHTTLVTDNNSAITNNIDLVSGTSGQKGGQYAASGVFQNNILLSAEGWNDAGSVMTQGCQSIQFMEDTTTLTLDHTAFVNGTASDYTGCAYGNNPGNPVSSPVLWFPTATQMCSYWANPAACTSGVQNLTLPDYHGFEQLCTGSTPSPYCAGQADQAADGTAAGANIAAIDTAATATQFVCPWACGSPGPYPDLVGSGVGVQAYTLGIDDNNQFPTSSHQIDRLWDFGGTEWSFVNTGTTTYGWSALDARLETMAQNGVLYAQMPLARTPNFISSNPVDTNCNYWTSLDSGTVNTSGTTVTLVSGTNFTTGSGWNGYAMVVNGGLYYIASVTSTTQLTLTSSAGTHSGVAFNVGSGGSSSNLPGQCDPPSDLNSDGTGSNLTWRNWAAALAAHVNQAGYLAGTGTWAAGGTNCPGTTACPHARLLIYETWNEPDDSAFFNGSYDQLIRMEQDLYCIVKGGSFTIAATGETCAQVRTAVTSVALTGPVDSTAWVVMPSYHGGTTAKAQAFLYCTGSGVGSSSCHSGGAAQTDAINFHLKPGNAGSLTAEGQLDAWVALIQGILQPAELAKPLFNTEGGFYSSGWVAPYTDANMQAGFIGRDYVYELAKGITNHVWYDWATQSNGLGSTTADTAYTQVESWLAGATFGGCTTSAPGTAGSGLYTYSCTLTLANGTAAMAIWDNSQTCTPCTSTNQNVPAQYTSYLTLAGGAATPMVGNTVAVGIEPVLVVAGAP